MNILDKFDALTNSITMACTLVQVELKRRGVVIHEVFNQVHRYSKESFNSDNSLLLR